VYRVACQRRILRQARAGNHDLIVMGVTRRTGEVASFGPLAETQPGPLGEIDHLAQGRGVALAHPGETPAGAVGEEESPEREILRQARAGNHDLIVMGVTRRTGEVASFGPLAGTAPSGRRPPAPSRRGGRTTRPRRYGA
jgi:nucleotide-binding universal stress UspA family protein